MAVTTTFNQALKIAVEIDRASAASGDKLGRSWWEGGRWFPVITDGLPSVQDNQAVIFPQGHAGDRRVNQQVPVVGRKWTEGDFAAPVVADFLGPLLYAAMGATSGNMTPTTTNASLLNNESLNSNPKSLVLVNQPSDSGAILRFDIKGDNKPAGTVSICGIDSYGNGASELISFASPGLVYSRTSWSSIAASGIAISGVSAGSVTIYGIQKFTHTFTSASVGPTLSFERIGNPTAGDASGNKNFIDPAMALKELTLENDSEAVDGIFKVSATFEGDPTGTSTATSLTGPSVLKIWPSWTLAVTRDNGTTWNTVTNISLTVADDSGNYRSAAGVQGPQGTKHGSQQYSGNITVLLNNEVEYVKWRNASQIRAHMLWSTPWLLHGTSVGMQLSASVPMYFESPQVQDSNGVYSFSGAFRVVRDDNFPMSFQLTNGVPGAAMGTQVI